MRLDRFDILVLASAAAIAVFAVGLGMAGEGEEAAVKPSYRVKAAPPEPAAYQEVARAETLLASEQAEDAVSLLEDLAAKYPSMSEPHALLGQAYARLLDYPAAMRQFRIALVMDPDYVDKKSAKFIGKRIKAAVKDGMVESRKAVSADPADNSARAALKDAYYLERMLAGGCE